MATLSLAVLVLILVLSGHGSDVLVLRGEQLGDRTNKTKELSGRLHVDLLTPSANCGLRTTFVSPIRP